MKLSEISKLLEVDLTSKTGLRWKVYRSYNADKGDEAGCLGDQGYYLVRFNGRMYRNHRIIYALHHKIELDKLPKQLDHIDRNRLNNNPSNLRPSTQSQNLANASLRSDNTSGFKGVSWSNKSNKWLAVINIAGKTKYLGLFVNIEDAKKAYMKAATDQFGEFAFTGYTKGT